MKASLRIVVPAVLAVGVASAVSYAAIGSGDAINGCVATSGRAKGQLRVLTDSGKCKKNETAISWSRTGPQGAPGAKGDAGPKGDTGPAGPQGAAGPASAADALVLGGRALEGADVDAHLKLDGIEGESTAAGYEGQTDLLSFHFAIDSDSGFGGGGGAPALSKFRVTALVDKSTPVLGKKALQGLHIPNVQISFVRSTPQGARQFMTVKLQQATITHWELGGDKEPARLMRVEFNPTSYEIAYRPIDAQGGLGGEVKFSHNRSTTAVS